MQLLSKNVDRLVNNVRIKVKGYNMKVDFTPTITSQKPTIRFKIKKFFTESRIKLKTLVKDVFEKNTKTNKIVTRKEPNWCQTNDDMPNNAVIDLSISFEEANAPLKQIGLDLNDFIKRK